MEKKILILLTRAPGGRIHVIEGARLAVGLLSVDHVSQLFFTGSSVFAARRDYRDRIFNSYLAELGGNVYIDSVALNDHGVDEDELKPWADYGRQGRPAF